MNMLRSAAFLFGIPIPCFWEARPNNAEILQENWDIVYIMISLYIFFISYTNRFNNICPSVCDFSSIRFFWCPEGFIVYLFWNAAPRFAGNLLIMMRRDVLRCRNLPFLSCLSFDFQPLEGCKFKSLCHKASTVESFRYTFKHLPAQVYLLSVALGKSTQTSAYKQVPVAFIRFSLYNIIYLLCWLCVSNPVLWKQDIIENMSRQLAWRITPGRAERSAWSRGGV